MCCCCMRSVECRAPRGLLFYAQKSRDCDRAPRRDLHLPYGRAHLLLFLILLLVVSLALFWVIAAARRLARLIVVVRAMGDGHLVSRLRCHLRMTASWVW